MHQEETQLKRDIIALIKEILQKLKVGISLPPDSVLERESITQLMSILEKKINEYNKQCIDYEKKRSINDKYNALKKECEKSKSIGYSR